MAHKTEPHAWDRPYEHDAASYRECTIEDCGCYQEWICALDRWSETFETPSPRQRLQGSRAVSDGHRRGQPGTGAVVTARILPSPRILYHHDAFVGEGPVWDPRIGKVVWVDIPNNHVFSTDPTDGSTTRRELDRAVGVVLPRASGGYVTALEDGFYALPDDGAPELIAPVEADDPVTRMNDGEIDPGGRFWAGTMGWHAEPEAGALYRLDPAGTVTRMLDGITISNGLGWSPDGTTMYYVDTPTMRVDMFDFDPATGDIANRREFVTIRAGGGRPDGLTVDVEGAVWVATWPGYGVHRYLPDGTLEAIIPLPVSNVSSIELGGPDMRDAFITTAWELLSQAEHDAQPTAGSLFHTRVEVPGQPRVPFAG